MPCDEYKKLQMMHDSAKYRSERYAHPETEPKLVSPTGKELKRRLNEAARELFTLHVKMRAHLAECEQCKSDAARFKP